MKNKGRVMQPFSAYHLKILYICTKFQENISKGFKVIKKTLLKFTKGHNSIKNVDGVQYLFCAHRLTMLYSLAKF